jgi:gas vesicle protein
MKKPGKIIGAGLALTAIAAAAAYFLTGKRGLENREKISAWTLKIKGDVLKEMKEMKDVNKDAYYALVDEVALRYKRVERVGAAELERMTKELKGAWKHISRQLK